MPNSRMKWNRNKSFKQSYRKSRRFDVSCRCNGSCAYCRNARLYNTKRRLQAWKQDLHDYLTDNTK